jgi:hypothetical protein
MKERWHGGTGRAVAASGLPALAASLFGHRVTATSQPVVAPARVPGARHVAAALARRSPAC